MNDNSVDPIDFLTEHMSNIVIDTNRVCGICRDTTYESIKNICENHCEYVCHEKCLRHWIQYRVLIREPVHCPQCLKHYSNEVINYACQLIM